MYICVLQSLHEVVTSTKVLQSLHKALPSTTVYYKACTKHFPVLLCTTKLARSRSQYYCVLQSLHKVVPSTTVYICVLQSLHEVVPSTKVLQSLHKALPSTTLYYKACAKHFPVLLCTTKLAQGTFQYYCVLQSLHKALPSKTLYYKACAKHFPVRTTLYYKACTKARGFAAFPLDTAMPEEKQICGLSTKAPQNRQTRGGVELARHVNPHRETAAFLQYLHDLMCSFACYFLWYPSDLWMSVAI